MRIRGKVFKGLPETAALLQPFISTGVLNNSGVPLGIDRRSGKLVKFDPWMLKLLDIIHSTVFLVIGDKNSGKSTLLKSLIVRLMALQAGVIDGQPQLMRSRINDRKPEGGRPEYQAVTDFLRSPTYALNRRASINIFHPDLGMGEFEIVETAINICEYVSGQKLTGFQVLALQVAVHKMLRLVNEISSPNVLEVVTRKLTLDDVDAYYSAANADVRNTFRRKLEADPLLRHQLDLILDPDHLHNVPEAEFARDSGIVADYFGRLLRADFGEIFGGENSLRDVLSQPMATLDWTGVNEKARTLLESMLWKWQSIALDNNDLDLIPHLNVGDEVHEAVGSLMHMRFWSESSKKARAFHTADFRITQYETDLTMGAADGSEVFKLAQGIMRGFGGRFVANQPNDDEILHRLSKHGISDYDLQLMTKQPIGGFAIVLPDRPVLFYQHILTPTEAKLVDANSATTRMTTRMPVWTVNDFRRREEELGSITVGAA